MATEDIDTIKRRLDELAKTNLKMREQVAKLKAVYLYSDEIPNEEKRKALSMLNWLSDEPPSAPLSEEEKAKLFSEIDRNSINDGKT